MEEIKKLLEGVITTKLLILKEITKKCDRKSVSSKLDDGVVQEQVQLSTEQTRPMSDNVPSDHSTFYPTMGSILSNNTSADKQKILEQFCLNGNLDFNGQQIIVDDINQHLSPKAVHILHDVENSTWICLQYCPKYRPYKMNVLTPGKEGWKDVNLNARQNITDEINEWLPGLKDPNPFAKFVLPSCSKSNDPATQFLYVLMFAFGCAANIEESFLNPHGDKPIEHIRKIICNVMSNGLENEMSMIQAIWNA